MATHFLSTSAGDGGLEVNVDAFGSFGSELSGNAFYDPVGPIETAGTTFETGVAIRIGDTGERTFLSEFDIGGSGNLEGVEFLSTSLTDAESQFNFSDLSFELVQTVEGTFDDANQRSGSLLTQTYSITNLGTEAIAFELIRYLDGDLEFDGSIQDGGGRISTQDQEILFETDTAGETATSTTFVGITAVGGAAPTSGRYEVEDFDLLRGKIIVGGDLNETIFGDGPDPDEFVDADSAYDVTLGLGNAFVLEPGGSDIYVTKTIFGSGSPEEVVVNLAPVAADDTYDLDEDITLTINSNNGVINNDNDPDGDALTATIVNGPTNGELNFNADGSFSYTPDANFNGTDSFTYIINDGSVDSNEATVTLNVSNTSDNINYSINTETPSIVEGDDGAQTVLYTITRTGAIQNASAIDYAISGSAAVQSDFDNVVLETGNAPLTDTIAFANGETQKTLSVDVLGDTEIEADETILVTISSGTAPNGTASITNNTAQIIIVNDDDVSNQPPISNGDTYSIDEDSTLIVTSTDGVISNDEDPEGDALSASLVNGPNNGALTFNTDGSFTYTPNENFNGTDNFTYSTNDGLADSTEATVQLTVNALNDAPTVNASIGDQFATENEAFTFTLPSDLFTDVDQGDILDINTGALPLWLTYDSITATFSGTPSTDDVESLAIELTASDLAGASVATSFNLTIEAADTETPLVNGQPATIYIDSNNTIVGPAFGNGKAYEGELFSQTDRRINPDDVILGTNSDDNIWAGTLGNDVIDAGTGNNTIGISAGNNTVIASSGNDFVYSNTDDGGTNFITLGAGDNSTWLTAGDNTITAENGNDEIGLGTGTDTVDIGDGNNIVYMVDPDGAADGNKDIFTGSGNDWVQVGSGDDLLNLGTNAGGEADFDIAIGQGGSDTFVLNLGSGYLTVSDFTQGEDQLGLNSLTFANDLGATTDTATNSTWIMTNSGDILAELQNFTGELVESDFTSV